MPAAASACTQTQAVCNTVRGGGTRWTNAPADARRHRAVTVERILRQKISKGVKGQMLARFDRNGDGTVSAAEFLNKVVANPMATLYAFMPSSVCLS